MKIRNTQVDHEKLVLEVGEELPVLGPNVELHGCDIEIAAPAQKLLFIPPLTFRNCSIRIRRSLVNFTGWKVASFYSCQFTGTMVGNRFGTQPEDWPEVKEPTVLVDCNFTATIVHQTDFFQVDMSQVYTPGWPHFTIVNPTEHFELLSQQPWPGKAFLTAPKPGVVGLCYNAELLARKFGGTVEEYRTIVSQFDELRK